MGDITYHNKDVASKTIGEALIGKNLAPFGLPHLSIVDILPTNLPAIETNELRLDNLFLLSDGSIAIIDYESEYSRENFVKYVNYVARVIKRYSDLKKLKQLNQIKIIIIYTADVEKAEEIFDLGGMILKVEAAYLVNQDSNETYQYISDKIARKEKLSDEDMMKMMILPLTVKGNEEKKKLAIKTVNLAKKLADQTALHKILAGILTFSDKFLDADYSKKVRDLMYMTQVERLIYDDGFRSGESSGIQQGIQQGLQQAGNVFSKLTLALLADERYQDLERASKDTNYREKLLDEYGIVF